MDIPNEYEPQLPKMDWKPIDRLEFNAVLDLLVNAFVLPVEIIASDLNEIMDNPQAHGKIYRLLYSTLRSATLYAISTLTLFALCGKQDRSVFLLRLAKRCEAPCYLLKGIVINAMRTAISKTYVAIC